MGKLTERVGGPTNTLHPESVVERLAAEAIGLGAETLDVEYEDGCEWAFATKAAQGYADIPGRLRRTAPMPGSGVAHGSALLIGHGVRRGRATAEVILSCRVRQASSCA